ncbi:hypothetical protein [Mucilaginibacter sp.]|uniref:hypothetical protein n=1 Tax=Mucilaginibacter sp. TaxID=1882438 RepID=UPI002ED4F726
MIPPTTINIITGAVSIQINSVLANILSLKKTNAIFEGTTPHRGIKSYRERKISTILAISIPIKNGIQLDESEAGVVLDFYIAWQEHIILLMPQITRSLSGYRTSKKWSRRYLKPSF